jgi:hypothetical protein
MVATFASGTPSPVCNQAAQATASGPTCDAAAPGRSRSAGYPGQSPGGDSAGSARRGSGTSSRAAAPVAGPPAMARARRRSPPPHPRSANTPSGPARRRPRQCAWAAVATAAARSAARPCGLGAGAPRVGSSLRERRGLALGRAPGGLALVAQEIPFALDEVPLQPHVPVPQPSVLSVLVANLSREPLSDRSANLRPATQPRKLIQRRGSPTQRVAGHCASFRRPIRPFAPPTSPRRSVAREARVDAACRRVASHGRPHRLQGSQHG